MIEVCNMWSYCLACTSHKSLNSTIKLMKSAGPSHQVENVQICSAIMRRKLRLGKGRSLLSFTLLPLLKEIIS